MTIFNQSTPHQASFKMKSKPGKKILEESIRCIYCKKTINDEHQLYEIINQVHLACKREIEEFQNKPDKLPDKIYKEFMNFFKSFNIMQYRYLSNRELFNLQTLNLNNKKITFLPNSINYLNNLKQLGLAGNLLSDLPENLGLMNHLEMINLSFNRFEEFPLIIEKLEKLKRIYYAGQKLEIYPESLIKFDQLEKLDLSQNRLHSLPESLGDKRTLKELYIQNNNLKEIPDSMGRLRLLHTLDVSNNRLKTIPHWLKYNNYQFLNLTNNPIEDIEIKLQKLKSVLLNGVLLQSERDKIL